MSGNTIRDFMVALGFSIDNAGAKRMGDTLQNVENKAKSLNTVLLGLATGAVIAVTKTASELDKLYYSSQRIGASANNIRGFEAAIAQMGGTAGNALQTLESLAQKVRQSPGYEGMVNNLGVSTRDQNGAMRDRVEVMKDMSKTLAGMEYYQANAYASALGIDESTLMAMRDPAFLQNMEKYQKLQKEMGMSNGLAESGKDFMVQFRDVTLTVKALSEVILMTAGKALIPVLKIINTGLQSAIQWFSGLDPRLKAFLATGLKIAMLALIFGGLFVAISKLAGVLSIIKGLLFLFRALNLAILASPIGIILALAAAIALLWDDYQTWKNGGKSLIDWGEWAGGIETAITRIKELAQVIMGLRDKAIELTTTGIEKTVEAAKTAVQVAKDVAKTTVAAVTEGAKSLGGIMSGEKPFKNAMSEFKGGAIKGLSPEETLAFANRVMFRENKSGKLGTTNKWGYTGKYQFGASALAEVGFIDPAKLKKASKGVRNGSDAKAHKAFLADKGNWLKGDWEQYKSSAVMQDESFKLLVEANLRYGQNVHGGDKRKMMGYAMAAHLKGAGNAAKWYKNGKDSKDGNGTNTSDYAKFGENFMEWMPQPAANLPKPTTLNNALPAGNPHKDQSNQATSKQSQSNVVSMNQKTDIHVYGSDNSQQAALAIQQKQDAVNTQMARNARSVIS